VKSGINLLQGSESVLFETQVTEGLYVTCRNSSTGSSVYTGGTATDGHGFQLLRDRSGNPRSLLDADMSGDPAFALVGRTKTVVLDMGVAEDASVALPGSSVSSGELLDEPGVANINDTGSVTLSGPLQSLLSRSITPPDDGYIVAMAGGYAQANHVNGTNSECQLGLSDAVSAFGVAQDVNVRVPSTAASGTFRFPVHMNAVFTATAGVTTTIHFLGEIVTGATLAVGDMTLTLVYVPTAYGAVSPALAASGTSRADDSIRGARSASEITAERAESEAFDRARVQHELAEMKQRLVEFEQRLAEDPGAGAP
jgi:hypothetical protein